MDEDSDNEQDTTYILLSSTTPKLETPLTSRILRKLTSDVVNASLYDEDHTLISLLTGAASSSEEDYASSLENGKTSVSALTSGSKVATALGSNSQGAIVSGDYAEEYSSYKENVSEDTPTPRSDDSTLVGDKPKRWCIEGKWNVYRDARMLNEKGVMIPLVTEERRVLAESFPIVHKV